MTDENTQRLLADICLQLERIADALDRTKATVQDELEKMLGRVMEARYAMVDGNLDGDSVHPAGIEGWLDHIAGKQGDK